MIFLDLEGTTVDEWASFEPLNEHLRAIARFLSKEGAQGVGIFSFSVRTEHDRREVEALVTPLLEKELEVPVVRIILASEVIQTLSSTLGVSLTHDDLTLWGKARVFSEWCQAHHMSGVLIDDAVMNRLIKDERGPEIRLINVERLHEGVSVESSKVPNT